MSAGIMVSPSAAVRLKAAAGLFSPELTHCLAPRNLSPPGLRSAHRFIQAVFTQDRLGNTQGVHPEILTHGTSKSGEADGQQSSPTRLFVDTMCVCSLLPIGKYTPSKILHQYKTKV